LGAAKCGGSRSFGIRGNLGNQETDKVLDPLAASASLGDRVNDGFDLRKESRVLHLRHERAKPQHVADYARRIGHGGGFGFEHRHMLPAQRACKSVIARSCLTEAIITLSPRAKNRRL
jgi:hypothetical protein